MFVILVVLFLLLRELVMWYLKINKRIELAERNNILLEKILDKFNNQILSTKEQIKNKKSEESEILTEEEIFSYSEFYKTIPDKSILELLELNKGKQTYPIIEEEALKRNLIDPPKSMSDQNR